MRSGAWPVPGAKARAGKTARDPDAQDHGRAQRLFPGRPGVPIAGRRFYSGAKSNGVGFGSSWTRAGQGESPPGIGPIFAGLSKPCQHHQLTQHGIRCCRFDCVDHCCCDTQNASSRVHCCSMTRREARGRCVRSTPSMGVCPGSFCLSQPPHENREKNFASLRRKDKSKKEKSKDPKPSQHHQLTQHGIRGSRNDSVEHRRCDTQNASPRDH